jgi:hypothetical protein
MERAHRPLSERARRRFLEALGTGWSVSAAAERAGRHRNRFYDLRERDDEFALEWSQAVERGTQVLEDEARRRAVDGVEEPVYQGGELVGVVRKYSDRLLEFLLRARRPAVYRENARIEVDSGVQVTAAIDRFVGGVRLGDVLRRAGETGNLHLLVGTSESDAAEVARLVDREPAGGELLPPSEVDE